MIPYEFSLISYLTFHFVVCARTSDLTVLLWSFVFYIFSIISKIIVIIMLTLYNL